MSGGVRHTPPRVAGGDMKDPNTSFGAWFQKVKADQNASGAGAGDAGPWGAPNRRGRGNGNGSLSVLNRLAFWRGNGSAPSNGSARDEAGTDVEKGGLLPTFMRRGRNKPKQSEWCDCGLSATQRFQAFVACVLGGAALMSLALFVFLPMVLLFPAKFALTFTLGSFLIQTAFAMLKGPAKYMRGLCSRQRAVGTTVYLISMTLTLYAAIIARSYILVIVSVCIQVAALVWSSVSYLPRGQAALSVFTTVFCKVTQVMCYPLKAGIKRLFSSSGSSS